MRLKRVANDTSARERKGKWTGWSRINAPKSSAPNLLRLLRAWRLGRFLHLLPERRNSVLDYEQFATSHGRRATPDFFCIAGPKAFDHDLLPRHVVHFLENEFCVKTALLNWSSRMEEFFDSIGDANKPLLFFFDLFLEIVNELKLTLSDYCYLNGHSS